MGKPNSGSVLVISDTHAPYHHKDMTKFLAAVKRRYRITRVIHIGDEVDGHGLSFHESDPDLYSPGHELIKARQGLAGLYKLFPVVDVLESNHGSLQYRRARASAMPAELIRPYREVLEAPKGWTWHSEILLRLPDGSTVAFQHGRTKDPLTWAKTVATHTVNGHFHEDFLIKYWRTRRGLYWSMVVGCLIDNDSRAFAYNKTNTLNPIIGVGVIINSHPILVPMILNSKNRWVGRLP